MYLAGGFGASGRGSHGELWVTIDSSSLNKKIYVTIEAWRPSCGILLKRSSCRLITPRTMGSWKLGSRDEPADL
jgi:hypothetical protein